MFAPFLIIEPFIESFIESFQSIRTRSRVVLCLRLLGRLKEAQPRGRTLALLIVLSIMVVPVVACAPPSTVPPLEPTTAPAVGPSPNPVLPHSDQGLRFERISIAQGLSHSTVNCILQDSKGFMWFGTNSGLNRYDGRDFTLYKRNPDDPHSLSHNRVQALFEDSTGTLWVGTYGGLNRFDRDSAPGAGARQFARYDSDDFQNVTGSPEEFRNAVAAIDEYPTGVLWIATNGGGLVRFDLETETFASYAPGPADPDFWGHEWIGAMLVDGSGMVWLGTDDRGLDRSIPPPGRQPPTGMIPTTQTAWALTGSQRSSRTDSGRFGSAQLAG